MTLISNVILIGMPGSGKSTTGVLAAKALGMRFLDADIVLQEMIGMLLHEHIDRFGIETFLDREGECLSRIDAKNSVIATGGSAVLRNGAMESLARGAKAVVYLRLSPRTLESRLTNIKTRGIAMEPGQTILDVYAIRAPLYERYATVTIDCEGQGVEDTVAALTRAVRKAL